MKIKIYTIGKIKESYLNSALEDYQKRLKGSCTIEWVLAKDDRHLSLLLPNNYIGLDPQGEMHTSESFSSLLHQSASQNFLIGGATGLTPKMKAEATSLISLSAMTFTHQLTRLILLEQIYRGCQIHLGTPYHK